MELLNAIIANLSITFNLMVSQSNTTEFKMGAQMYCLKLFDK